MKASKKAVRRRLPPSQEEAARLIGWYAATLTFFGTWVIEAFTWLKTGVWPAWSIGDLGHTPQYSWRGVQKIVDLLMTLPVGAFYALCAGISAAWLAARILHVRLWWKEL